MNGHIHSPSPIEIREITHGTRDRFGRLLILTDCCRKRRKIENVVAKCYEWYDPYIVCKPGKGCKK